MALELSSPPPEPLSLRLSKAARKRLAKAKKLKVSALVVAVDAAGNRSTTTSKPTLRA